MQIANVIIFVFRFQAADRDEESESQRKARCRLMRQSRRLTQVMLILFTFLKRFFFFLNRRPILWFIMYLPAHSCFIQIPPVKLQKQLYMFA